MVRGKDLDVNNVLKYQNEQLRSIEFDASQLLVLIFENIVYIQVLTAHHYLPKSSLSSLIAFCNMIFKDCR